MYPQGSIAAYGPNTQRTLIDNINDTNDRSRVKRLVIGERKTVLWNV